MRILITGASGFLGRRLVEMTRDVGHIPAAVVRGYRPEMGSEQRVCEDLTSAGSLERLVEGIDAVVNCAGRTGGAVSDVSGASPVDYRTINEHFPVALAKVSRGAGVKRFVQVSSVAAIKSSSEPIEVITDASLANPRSAYGRTKLSADRALEDLSSNEMPIISLRPPAIFGARAGGPFALLMRWARIGVPLPIGAIVNRRSFMFVDNLVDAIHAACEIDLSGSYIVTDSPPISTAEMYRRLLAAHGHGDRAWRWPAAPVEAMARVMLGARADSLVGNAAYDGGHFARAAGWRPPVSLDAAIARTVARNR